ncbi:MAG TPA: hypothetical protein VLE89_03835 [Chlamydiales bacterium]|nr:hypothetical protein [Chlamydiales bacterium]
MDRWSAPFLGLGYFLSKPRLWGWALLATFIAFTLTLAVCIKVTTATYPPVPTFWPILRSLGWGLFTLILMIIFIFPLIFNACFAKALAKEENQTPGELWISSFWVFLRTLKWRILWPLLLLATLLYLPPLIFPISLLAANHLAVLESLDLSLTIFGLTADQRVAWIKNHGTDCFAIALSGSLLALLLSLILIGWLFWIPALYCGTFLWVKNKIIPL